MKTSSAEQDYSPIRVSTLRGDRKIPFDVYLKVAGKFIHYCRSGSSFEGVRLERLKTKKLKKMYIRVQDEIPYEQYLEASIDAAYTNKGGMALETRAEVIQGFQQASAEEYMEDPLDEKSYQHVRSSVQRFVEFLEKDPAGAQSILRLKNSEQSITHHSVNVSTLSVSIALENQMRAGVSLHHLALGGLLHDIEHFYESPDTNRSLTTMAKADLAKYHEHTLNGARRFQGVTFVDQLVLNIITQHEENASGSGFPKGLMEKEMDPLVLVAATANAYDRLVSFENLDPKDALKTLLIDKLGLYPLPLLQSLQNILKKQQLI